MYGDQVVWQGALGIADRSSNRPVTLSTQFRIGSVSKIFISLAVLRLVEHGRLSLQDPLRGLVPEIGIKNPWDESDPVRLVHVLEHTSGFDDLRFRDYSSNTAGTTLLQGLRNNIGSMHSRWRPGTRAAYSNIGPFTAALAVEHVTGMPYRDFVTRDVFDSLGMSSATFDAKGPDLAVSHRDDESPVPFTHLAVRPGGALSVTSDDMIRLLRFFHGRGTLDGRTILTSASILRMERPHSLPAARAGIRLGMGLGNTATVRNGFLFQGHTGGIESFATEFAYLPEHGRGYFVSMNADSDRAFSKIEKELTAFITRGLSPLAAQPIIPLSDEQLHKYEGVYEPVSPTIQITAAFERFILQTIRLRRDGALYAGSPLTGYKQLQPVGGDLFRVGDEPVPSLAFIRAPEGDFLAQSAARTYRRIPAFWAYGRLVLVILSVPILLSTLLFFPVWLLRKVSGRLRGVPHLSLRVPPLIGTVLLLMPFVLAIIGGRAAGSGRLASLNLVTVGWFIGSILFAVVSIFAALNLVRLYPQWHRINRFAFIHSVLATGAMLIVTIFLIDCGLLGLRTWSY